MHVRTDRIVEVVGVSRESWEAAGRAAVADIARTVPGLRAAEILKQDLVVEDGAIVGYRVRMAVALSPVTVLVADTADACDDDLRMRSC